MSLLSEASLIVTPNGYKEGTLYSVIPSDGSGDMSVVRATTATRVNSAGLVELVPYNYNTYSENFITSWGNDGTSTVTNNFTTAPNGMMTAAKLVSNVANGYGYKFNTVPNGTFTLSYYIKANANTTIAIAFNDIGGNGYIGSYGIAVTTEWQRISLTANLVGTSLLIDYSQLQLGVEYYIWGCQINEGTLKDYQKTETRLNIPRLDYSNGTCPSLLVEPQRTNSCLWSSDITNAVWDVATGGGGASAIRTANYGIAPDGTMTADRLQLNKGASGYAECFQYPISITNGATYTFSAYVKSLSGNVSFLFGFNGSAREIENATTEWTRITWTTTAVGTVGGAAITLYDTYDPNTSASVDLLVWGFQLEQGSYATSYIPTTSASVTRNADAVFKTGISSLIGQTEGVAFIDFIWNGLTGLGSYPRIIELWEDSSNYIQLYSISGTTSWGWDIYNGGVVQFSGSSTMALGHNKIAIAYKLNDIVIYKNGSLVASDTTCTIPTTSSFGLTGTYNGVGGAQLAASVNASALWKTRLTNAQLATLTTI